jgi:hypothetical protein
MFDGSALPLKENLDIAVKLIERFRESDLILEIEAGVVGGEEDGIKVRRAQQRNFTPHPRNVGGRAAIERRKRRTLLACCDLRQRARRVQARPCQAQAFDPEGLPRCCHQQIRRRGTLLLCLPRRVPGELILWQVLSAM